MPKLVACWMSSRTQFGWHGVALTLRCQREARVDAHAIPPVSIAASSPNLGPAIL